MSVAQEEVSHTLNSLDSLTLEDRSETSTALPLTLETLPNELLSSIVLNLDKFVFPPLSRRLLPFHRSSLYRTVSITLKQFDAFYYTVELYPHLPEFVEDLTFSFTIPLKERNSNSLSIPPRKYQSELLASLPNLNRLTIIVDERWKSRFSPSFKDFERNPKLRILIMKSSCLRFSVGQSFDGRAVASRTSDHEEEEDQPGDKHEGHKPIDIFSFAQLGSIECYKVPQALSYVNQNDPRFPDPETVFEICRKDSASNALEIRYFGVAPTEDDLAALSRCLSSSTVSDLRIVYFDSTPCLKQLLESLSDPRSLKRLSLYTYGEDSVLEQGTETTLVGLVNLKHLSIGGNAFRYFPRFYETLAAINVEHLHIGPRVKFNVQPPIDILKKSPRIDLPKLTTFVLDNIDTKSPGIPVLMSFRDVYPGEEIEELALVAGKSGVKTSGTTFDAVGRLDGIISDFDSLLAKVLANAGIKSRETEDD